MEKELFALLRLGLGNTTAGEENLSDFIMLSTGQWARIGELAQEQGVLGVMLDGIDRLEETGYGTTRQLSKYLKIKWIGNVLQGYENRNQSQLAVIDILQKKWAEADLRMMVMKGQAMGSYYPISKHRCPGDIDCYLFDDFTKGNEVAKSFADNVDEHWYKHSVISYKGESIENHQFFVHTRDGKRSKSLNQVLVDSLENQDYQLLPGTEALLPPPMFNALFLTYHALAHFLEEGLRLKQILDWAMFLKKDADRVDWKEFYRLAEHFHLKRFAEVVTDIAVNYLGVQLSNEQIVSSSSYTQKVIESTLYDKEYVFSSGESGWANRLHIVTNLFKYRWKYHDIYQSSVMRQVWFFVIGFLFKTE